MTQYFRKVSAGLVKADIENFIGESGNLFFGIDTGEFRLSDGVTPGGIPIGTGGGGGYTLRPATNTRLGGVKIGDNINVELDGTISIPNIPTDISQLTDTTHRLDNNTILVSNTTPASPAEGMLWWKPSNNILYIYHNSSWVEAVVASASYTLPTATSSILGGVKIGANINVTNDGTISVSKGAGINTVVDISDVYTGGNGNPNLTDGALLVYNNVNARWDTKTVLTAETMDGGEY